MHQISTKYTRHQAFRGAEQQEINEANSPEHDQKHHTMSHAMDSSRNIYSFIQENSSDPAKMVGSACHSYLQAVPRDPTQFLILISGIH